MSKYYLGLDIGTDSVGFCVTDENYNIIKKHKTIIDGDKTKYYGNHLWGARLFDEAKDAKYRRSARESRRRLQRRKQRILYLQDIFSDERKKVDPYFFDRLNNSAIHLEDRDELLRQNHLLFNDKGYTDREFYEKYPTIFHLRKAILEHPETKFDIREVYLVLAHRIKYRGNFLHPGEMKAIGSDPETIVSSFDELDNTLKSLDEIGEASSTTTFCCDLAKANELIEVFQTVNKVGDLSDRITSVLQLNDKKSNSLIRQLIGLISGSKKKLNSLFSEINWDEVGEELGKTDIDFGSEDFLDKTLPTCSSVIGDERTDLLIKSKDIYDLRILCNLLKGKAYLSDARVDRYNEHQQQLKILKDLIKRYNPGFYSAFFRKFNIKVEGKKDPIVYGTYAGYIGYNVAKKKIIRVKHSTSQDDLYAAVKFLLPLDKASSDDFNEIESGDKRKLRTIKDQIENHQYLLRQNSKENGVLPYQLNLNERRIILKNQSAYYPFLSEMDKDFGNPDKQCPKIESILKYKIPYYVGPLSTKAKNQWIVRKSDEKITPWNFHDVVDKKETANKFIENLKNYCTYLINEPTLPKQSLVFQRFTLLNERNKWKINGSYISVEDKEWIIKNVYLKQKKVTKKSIESSLTRKYKGERISLTSSGTKENGEKGVTNEDLHASLSSWIAFIDDRAFGYSLLTDKSKQELAEKIIYDITMFEDKELRLDRLKEYKLTPNQIRYRANLKFEGWAKLSGKLLTGLTTDLVNQDTGEISSYSIMDLRWWTNDNFRQIRETKEGKDYKYSFTDQIEKLNDAGEKTLDDIISNLYVSPIRKRALHQSIDVVLELKKVLKINHFDSYFVESTRSDGEKKRTLSRQKKIISFYKDISKKLKSEIDIDRLTNEVKEKSDNELKGKKLYLYFRQGGKSVYTGEPIDINDFSAYDIDHIIPQAKVKDDSFINTVLVEKKVNNVKSDNYPIPKGILTEKGIHWVKFLHSANSDLMPEEKRNRILRPTTKPLSTDELSGYVQRQLVSTNQSVKAVCEVLKTIDKDAKVVYSKASNVSEFRQIFGLTKSREANDFHHAHDAYLNIVVGNVYNKVFSSGDSHIVKRKLDYLESRNRSTEYRFKNDERRLYTDTLVWKAKKYEGGWRGKEISESEGDIDKIRKYLSYQNPLVTQRRYVNVGKRGLFNKISIHTAKEGNAAFPLKTTGPFSKEGYATKYGGYSDLSNPYSRLVRSEDKKGKHLYSIEFVPAIILNSFKGDKEKIKEYLETEKKLKNPEIIIDKLLRKTIIQIPYTTEKGVKGNVRIAITGKSTNGLVCINMSELHRPNEYMKTVKKISKLLGLNNQAGTKIDTKVYDKYGTNDIDGKITRDELFKLFKYRTEDVYCRPQYEGIPTVSSTIKKIKASGSAFVQLKTIDQAAILANRIKIISCKSETGASMTMLGGSKNVGSIQPSNVLIKGSQLIQTSVTGLYEKVLFTVPED